jgi:hypothetical protein
MLSRREQHGRQRVQTLLQAQIHRVIVR